MIGGGVNAKRGAVISLYANGLGAVENQPASGGASVPDAVSSEDAADSHNRRPTCRGTFRWSGTLLRRPLSDQRLRDPRMPRPGSSKWSSRRMA